MMNAKTQKTDDRATGSEQQPSREQERVTTSSGISFSMPDWAEPGVLALESGNASHQDAASQFDVQYF
jgi:hypothetical protein